MSQARRLAAVAGVVALGGLLSGMPAAGSADEVAVDARITSVDGTLHLTGEVSGSGDKVTVLRARSCRVVDSGAVRCDFQRYRTVKQARDGSFAVPLEVPERPGRGRAFYWQARVAGADTEVWRTYRVEP